MLQTKNDINFFNAARKYNTYVPKDRPSKHMKQKQN